jgi:6,7-dimethyl-8-ribityllumazine synthase
LKRAPQDRKDARGLRFLLLCSEWNAKVVDGLADGARAALAASGARHKHVESLAVPGAFELPLAALAAAQSGRFDAIVALGAVIRGDTDHYEHIARESSRGLAAVALATGVPVGFGVLTCQTEAQAQVRSAPGAANKGGEAARAALGMVHLLRTLATKRRKPRGKR